MSARKATTGPGLPPRNNRDHAGIGHARADLEPQRPQMVGNELRRPHLAIAQLRMLMDVPPPRNHLRLDSRRETIEIGRQRLGLRQSG